LELKIMQKALHLRTTVLPGGKIEIVDQELCEGESVDVLVLHSEDSQQQSVLDVLAAAPGQRVYKTVEDVDTYLKGERDSWER
jgi:hypothetical protein